MLPSLAAKTPISAAEVSAGRSHRDAVVRGLTFMVVLAVPFFLTIVQQRIVGEAADGVVVVTAQGIGEADGAR